MNNSFIRTPLEITDAYKLSHWAQYPKGRKTVLKNLCKSRQSYGKFFLKQEGMSRVYPEYNLCESGKTLY